MRITVGSRNFHVRLPATQTLEMNQTVSKMIEE
jgi:hypothetical protein